MLVLTLLHVSRFDANAEESEWRAQANGRAAQGRLWALLTGICFVPWKKRSARHYKIALLQVP